MASQLSAPSRSIPPLVIRSAIVTSLGGLLFGFNTTVISGAEEELAELYALSSTGEGMIVTIVTIDMIVDAIITGNLADRFGRKPVLFWIGILFGIGAFTTTLVPLLALVSAADGTVSASSMLLVTFSMVSRSFGGVGMGLSSVVVSICTAETAPAHMRGCLIGLVRLNIAFGVPLAYASNVAIRETVHEDTVWRWMLGVMAVPAIFFLALLATVLETPHWLLAHGREGLAMKVSEYLTASQAEYDEQIGEMKTQVAEDAAGGKIPFFTRRHREIILMTFCIAMSNQLSGISAILYYTPKIMRLTGGVEVLSDTFPHIGSVIVGLMNLVTTMVALTVIDRIGCRQLMIVGSIDCLISLGFLADMTFAYEGGYFEEDSAVPVWLVLLGLLGFIASYALGQGSVIRVSISEIFPNRVCVRGQPLGSFIYWALAFTITYAFPVLIDKLRGGYAFGIFFLATVGQLFWVLKIVPEAKSILLEEMEEKLGLISD